MLGKLPRPETDIQKANVFEVNMINYMNVEMFVVENNLEAEFLRPALKEMRVEFKVGEEWFCARLRTPRFYLHTSGWSSFQLFEMRWGINVIRLV